MSQAITFERDVVYDMLRERLAKLAQRSGGNHIQSIDDLLPWLDRAWKAVPAREPTKSEAIDFEQPFTVADLDRVIAGLRNDGESRSMMMPGGTAISTVIGALNDMRRDQFGDPAPATAKKKQAAPERVAPPKQTTTASHIATIGNSPPPPPEPSQPIATRVTQQPRNADPMPDDFMCVSHHRGQFDAPEFLVKQAYARLIASASPHLVRAGVIVEFTHAGERAQGYFGGSHIKTWYFPKSLVEAEVARIRAEPDYAKPPFSHPDVIDSGWKR